MTDAEKLRRVIEGSGLSARAFATEVLFRDERTIRRWLSGDRPIPNVIADRLDDWLKHPPTKA